MLYRNHHILVKSPEGKASGRSRVGLSPGHKIDLQEKLLKQVDLLHQMFGVVQSQQINLS